jgi:Mrp family chromosome partitioning ATPase
MSGVDHAAVEFGGMAANTFALLQTQRAQGERVAPVVVVTSALAGEGKSFIAEGLSVHLAALSAKRVLLVDANPIRPSTTTRFKAGGRTGLVELLLGERGERGGSVEAVATEMGNLSVLGIGKRVPETTLMFREGSLNRLLAWVSQRCDVCVVDAGPLSEPGASMLVDGAMQAVLVVDSLRTSRDAVADAISKNSRRPLTWGVVLNRHFAPR